LLIKPGVDVGASPVEALADRNTEDTQAGTSMAFGVDRVARAVEKSGDLLDREEVA